MLGIMYLVIDMTKPIDTTLYYLSRDLFDDDFRFSSIDALEPRRTNCDSLYSKALSLHCLCPFFVSGSTATGNFCVRCDTGLDGLRQDLHFADIDMLKDFVKRHCASWRFDDCPYYNFFGVD